MNLEYMLKRFYKIVNIVLIIAFVGSSLYIPQAQAGEMVLLHFLLGGFNERQWSCVGHWNLCGIGEIWARVFAMLYQAVMPPSTSKSAPVA